MSERQDANASWESGSTQAGTSIPSRRYESVGGGGGKGSLNCIALIIFAHWGEVTCCDLMAPTMSARESTETSQSHPYNGGGEGENLARRRRHPILIITFLVLSVIFFIMMESFGAIELASILLIIFFFPVTYFAFLFIYKKICSRLRPESQVVVIPIDPQAVTFIDDGRGIGGARFVVSGIPTPSIPGPQADSDPPPVYLQQHSEPPAYTEEEPPPPYPPPSYDEAIRLPPPSPTQDESSTQKR
ncbi:unnamed protein product [Darwinula stevensoni]|uniref:Transmembrane protein n=1 Tax=Darwinula stevensoni TaxID=69355 RepID=A0A7R9FNW2_9CRUS|nr:unnamed protein product [Darwinula stevensoni]CAG0896918.1 unnamed protein product [Darwinula stevensoni]